MSNQSDFGDDFDPTTEKKRSGVVPAGDYRCLVEECKIKPSKKGEYDVVNVTLSILDGEFINRKIFCRFNFKWIARKAATKKQETAVQIGRGEFAELCRAVGLGKPKSCDELTMKTVLARVKIKKGDENYDDQNEVKKFMEAAAGKGVALVAGKEGPAKPAASKEAAAGDWES